MHFEHCEVNNSFFFLTWGFQYWCGSLTLAHRESRDYFKLFPMVQSWVIFWCRPLTNLHKPTLTPLAGILLVGWWRKRQLNPLFTKKYLFVQMWATWLVVSSLSGVLQCAVWCDWISRTTDLCPSRSAQNKLMLLLPEVGLLGNKINTSKLGQYDYGQ